jgi:hypothetical protein
VVDSSEGYLLIGRWKFTVEVRSIADHLGGDVFNSEGVDFDPSLYLIDTRFQAYPGPLDLTFSFLDAQELLAKML